MIARHANCNINCSHIRNPTKCFSVNGKNGFARLRHLPTLPLLLALFISLANAKNRVSTNNLTTCDHTKIPCTPKEANNSESSGDEASPSFQNNLIAVAISLLGSCFTAVSLTIWKLASMKYDKQIQLQSQLKDQSQLKPRCLPQSVYCTPLWILGLVLAIVSVIVNSISLGYGSVMLLSSLSVATIAISSLITPCFFNEKLSFQKDVLCSFILFIGCVICISQSPEVDDYPAKNIAA
jgi:hypothetical protein